MRISRLLLMFFSGVLVLCLIGGGLAVRVGAAENQYQQPILFTEVLDLVLENYVDPVEAQSLFEGAYEGLLAGLDPNGAYLTAQELIEWRALKEGKRVDPGTSVLKSGRTLLVVAVDAESSAAELGVAVGDQIRLIDGRSVRDLSLEQSRRLLAGPPGSSVTVGLMHPSDGFSREEVVLVRDERKGAPYDLDVDEGVAVLSILDLNRVPIEELVAELDDVHSRGIESLLIDLRNVADVAPRDVAAFAALISPGAVLELTDREERKLEVVSSPEGEPAWSGTVSVLVNGATAGGAEALAQLFRNHRQAVVYGITTFGFGAEPELIEFEGGGALLISVAQWQTETGESWNGSGIKPDLEIRGDGESYDQAAADQLEQVLQILRERLRAEDEEEKAA